MRLTGIVLAILGLSLGGLVGHTARQYAGLSAARAEAIATDWLVNTMKYTDVELKGTERFDYLEGSSWPPNRKVYGVSTMVTMGGMNGLTAFACLGVVIDAQTGEVYGATGGNVPWLRC